MLQEPFSDCPKLFLSRICPTCFMRCAGGYFIGNHPAFIGFHQVEVICEYLPFIDDRAFLCPYCLWYLGRRSVYADFLAGREV